MIRRLPLRQLVHRPEAGTFVALVLLYLFFVATSSAHGFTGVTATSSWLDTSSSLGLIAIPVGLLMIAGEFDLSIGSMVGASSMTIGILSGHFHEPVLLSSLVALGLAVVVGFGNGILVTRTRLPSFIVTLAANLILAGLALTVGFKVAGATELAVPTNGTGSSVFAGSAHGFQVSIVWWLAIAVIAVWVLSQTRFGNWILATGGNADNARRFGVPTAKVRIVLFISTAMSAALVGIMQAIQYGSGSATTGSGYVFEAPIVVVIGGVLLTGGSGSVLGVVFGTLIYGIANAGLFYAGWDTNYAQVIIGVLMIAAVLTNNFVRRIAVSARSRRHV